MITAKLRFKPTSAKYLRLQDVEAKHHHFWLYDMILHNRDRTQFELEQEVVWECGSCFEQYFWKKDCSTEHRFGRSFV